MNIENLILAAEEIIECQRILANTGDNVVGELLRTSDKFIEWEHYPNDDVIDKNTGAQYYYHAHPTPTRDMQEHGHFHIFMRNKHGDAKPPLTHIIALSMNEVGAPQALFTVNHWVTGGIWENANVISEFLEKFNMDHAQPSWPTNRFINAILKLYQDDIKKLLIERDACIDRRKSEKPDEDIFESRDLEVTSFLPISIEEKLHELLVLEENANVA